MKHIIQDSSKVKNGAHTHLEILVKCNGLRSALGYSESDEDKEMETLGYTIGLVDSHSKRNLKMDKINHYYQNDKT